jgi:small subunit ribosomal protein S9
VTEREEELDPAQQEEELDPAQQEQEERVTAQDQPAGGSPPETAAPETEAPAMPAPEEVAPEAVAPEPETVEAEPPAPAEPEAVEPPDAEAEAEEAEPEPVPTITELAAGARYIATGKRKSSVARVIIKPGTGDFQLNGRSLEVYFPRRTHQVVVRQPLEAVGFVGQVDVVARIHGGGISGQADAVRHGIAKALIEAEPALRGELKRRQLLTRDPREKERRKAGLKKARKRPQFSKR